jgi:hypothetical protein
VFLPRTFNGHKNKNNHKGRAIKSGINLDDKLNVGNFTTR